MTISPARLLVIITIIIIITSCKYPFSGRSCLSPAGLYCLGPAGLCPPYLSCSNSLGPLEFSRPLRASVRSFISIRQVASNDLGLD